MKSSPQTSTRSTFNYDTRHHVFKVTKLVWSWNTLRPHSTQNVYILSLDTIYRSFKYIRWNKLAKSWSMRTSQQPTEQQHFRKNGHSVRNINSRKPNKIAGSCSRRPRSQTPFLALANTSFSLWEMARHARMQHLRWIFNSPEVHCFSCALCAQWSIGNDDLRGACYFLRRETKNSG